MAEVTRQLFEQMRDASTPLQKFVVVSGSMEPLIPVGAEVIVDVAATPKRFDVIAFWGEGKLTCHVLWHINTKVHKESVAIYQTCTLRGQSVDLAIQQTDYLGTVLNFRLSLLDKLKLVWKLRQRGL